MPSGETKIEQGKKTKQKILEKGLQMWLKNPDSVTAHGIAAKLNPKMTHAAVMYHFKNVKDAVAAYAVEQECSPVIAQLIASKHAAVKKMSEADKTRHLKAL